MAGKRAATSVLHHDNWDDEDDVVEEAGTFKQAAQDVLERRVIKAAKRRAVPTGDDSKVKNVFNNFTGFSKLPTTSNSSFNFGINPTKVMEAPKEIPKITTSIFSNNDTSAFSSTTKTNLNDQSPDDSNEYYAKLKGLNESVSHWIKAHVDANPVCILTPIFKDYERYLTEIETKHKSPQKTNVTHEEKDKDTPFKSPAPLFNFGSKIDTNKFAFHKTPDKEETVKSPTFSATPEAKPTNQFVTPFGNTAAFSFGNKAASPPGFQFEAGKPFALGNVVAPPSAEPQPDAATEDEEPPKAEFTAVTEEGSVYNIKCKVFVKKESEFVERGIGQLYLKPVAGGPKTQLIVRADTNLGNLILNLILSKQIPITKKGKNNVMLISIPTPESKPPPTAILIKVKTAEDADRLLEVLQKHQN